MIKATNKNKIIPTPISIPRKSAKEIPLPTFKRVVNDPAAKTIMAANMLKISMYFISLDCISSESLLLFCFSSTCSLEMILSNSTLRCKLTSFFLLVNRQQKVDTII